MNQSNSLRAGYGPQAIGHSKTNSKTQEIRAANFANRRELKNQESKTKKAEA
jgi:hypothetical protein